MRTVDPTLLLTQRELDVLQLIADGKVDREIGEALHLAPDTAKRHVRTAMRRLCALNRTHAVAIAWRAGVIT